MKKYDGVSILLGILLFPFMVIRAILKSKNISRNGKIL